MLAITESEAQYLSLLQLVLRATIWGTYSAASEYINFPYLCCLLSLFIGLLVCFVFNYYTDLLSCLFISYFYDDAFINLFICLFLYFYICFFIYLYICLFIYLYISLFLYVYCLYIYFLFLSIFD